MQLFFGNLPGIFSPVFMKVDFHVEAGLTVSTGEKTGQGRTFIGNGSRSMDVEPEIPGSGCSGFGPSVR